MPPSDQDLIELLREALSDVPVHLGGLVHALTLGDIGRVVRIEGDSATVEFFDVPGVAGSFSHVIPIRDLRPAKLHWQTRVHWIDDGMWRHGRVLDHLDRQRIVVRRKNVDLDLREDEAVVRRRAPVRDAAAFLAARWVESRRFHDARRAFVTEYLRRRAVYQGLTALSSAAVELHAHQVEALRRVMTDVQPRYLLADEVGLGKTIEAGLLLRQHLLDDRQSSVAVIVPKALVKQWRDELIHKFRFAEQFDGRWAVGAYDDAVADEPSMIVVDEAHRLTRSGSADAAAYAAVRAAAARARGVLLLSATPLLERPVSLQRLLHLLAPAGQLLGRLEDFERSLNGRDEIARHVAVLDPLVPSVILRQALDALLRLLADDSFVVAAIDRTREALDDGATLAQEIRRLRLHVSEVHRVHRRMVRSRRGTGLAADFPVLGRRPPAVLRVADHPAVQGCSAWIGDVLATHEKEPLAPETLEAATRVAQAASEPGEALARTASAAMMQLDAAEIGHSAMALLEEVRDAALARARSCPKVAVGVQRSLEALAQGKRVAVAAGSDEVAAEVAAQLRETASRATVLLLIAGSEGHPAGDFERLAGPGVLVFGSTGEEGQNLQSAEVIVHLDLPWDANRLEQRLGRFDRFGPYLEADHVVVLGDSETLEDGWFRLLSDGFGIFDRSIASAQQAVARLRPALDEAALWPDGSRLTALVERVQQELDEEERTVTSAELLDEALIDDRSQQLLDSIEQAETRAGADAWRTAVMRWSTGGGSAAHLRFHARTPADGEDHFLLTPFDEPNVRGLRDQDLPLIPLHDLRQRFSGAFSDGRAVGTFRRTASVNRRLRLFGPGDPFIDALFDFTEADDRGRSFAVCRAHQAWHGRDEALAWLFDLRLEADLGPALSSVADPEGSRSALQRRAGGYLENSVESVWLTSVGREITHEGLLRLVNAPYNERTGDRTIHPEHWDRLLLNLPGGDWSGTCLKLRDRALATVEQRADLRRTCHEAAERALADTADVVAQRAAREGVEAAEQEQALGKALAQGVRYPVLRVEACGVVLLTDRPLQSRADED
jgi:ATP-dependent helicase HepA